MTQEEFIKELDGEDYSYKIEGGKLIVTAGDSEGNFDLYLGSIPSDVIFRNPGYVDLLYIDNIPSGVDFRNGGDVRFSSVTSIEKGVHFNNHGEVYLKSIFGSWAHYWEGAIEGIGTKRLLNKMISIGLFDRRK